MPVTSLPAASLSNALDSLKKVQASLVRRYPGDSGARQPVHVVYGGAHLFSANTARKLGDLALTSLTTYAPDAKTFGKALGLDAKVAARVYPRVVAKLKREPVEDLRIDFEDGYGHRPDDEEDAHAQNVAKELALGMKDGTLPPFVGFRIKPLSPELAPRALRTLDLVLTALLEEADALPDNFVVTLPKVTSPEQVRVLVDVFEALERQLELSVGTLKMELMVEATQCIVDPLGRAMLPQLVESAGGRLVGAHFGTYDYTATADITAAEQRLTHPAADFGKGFMKVCLSGTGVFLSDGATTVMPVPPHRGAKLSAKQKTENKAAVHAAWRRSADDIRHSLAGGFYQGWDLHPAQLPARYGTVYAFFLENLEPASARLASFVKGLGQASLMGDVFDDAATGQGLLNYFVRGINCGALTEDDAARTGLTLEELRGRSFMKIVEGRRAEAR